MHGTVVTKERNKNLVPNMPVWFVLICGIVLERKKLPEIGNVAQNLKSCPKSEKLPKSYRASYGQPKKSSAANVFQRIQPQIQVFIS